MGVYTIMDINQRKGRANFQQKNMRVYKVDNGNNSEPVGHIGLQ